MFIDMKHSFTNNHYRLQIDQAYIDAHPTLKQQFENCEQLSIYCIVHFDETEINMDPVTIDFPIHH